MNLRFLSIYIIICDHITLPLYSLNFLAHRHFTYSSITSSSFYVQLSNAYQNINICVEVDRWSIVEAAEIVLTKKYRNTTRNNKSIWDTTKPSAHYFGQYIYSTQKYMVLSSLYVDNMFIVHIKRLIVAYQFPYIKSPAQNWVAN